jgi:hypothetical protein
MSDFMEVDLDHIEDVKLNEYTKDEWKDVALHFKPGLTDEEYDEMWNGFRDFKAEHLRKKSIQ